VTSEYGISAATGGGHVRMTTQADASYVESSDGKASSIADFVKANVANGTFPAPTAQTLYVVYFPESSTITLDGDAVSCTTFGGYHLSTEVTPPGGREASVPYAVVPRCADPNTLKVTEAYITTNASHEVLEAVQNVTPLSKRGWAMSPTTAWGVILPETADLCANEEIATQVAFRKAFGTDVVTEGGFTLQRGWSNAAARANHDPCVPALPGAVYFNAAPEKDAIQIAVGKSATIPIDAFSEAATDPWTAPRSRHRSAHRRGQDALVRIRQGRREAGRSRLSHGNAHGDAPAG